MPSPTNVQEAFEYIVFIAKIAIFFIGIIATLVIYVWHMNEKAIAKLEDLITRHLSEDDDTHDKLFTEVRRHGEVLARLNGEHDTYKQLRG